MRQVKKMLGMDFLPSHSSNVAFRLVSLHVLKLGRPVPAVWLDSNAVEMTTAEHYMYLTKLYELLACQCYSSGD